MFSCLVKATSTGPITVLSPQPFCRLREGVIEHNGREIRIFFRRIQGQWYEFHCRSASVVRALWNRTNVFRAIAIPAVARNRGYYDAFSRVAGGGELRTIRRADGKRYVYVERDSGDVESWRDEDEEGVLEEVIDGG